MGGISQPGVTMSHGVYTCVVRMRGGVRGVRSCQHSPPQRPSHISMLQRAQRLRYVCASHCIVVYNSSTVQRNLCNKDAASGDCVSQRQQRRTGPLYSSAAGHAGVGPTSHQQQAMLPPTAMLPTCTLSSSCPWPDQRDTLPTTIATYYVPMFTAMHSHFHSHQGRRSAHHCRRVHSAGNLAHTPAHSSSHLACARLPPTHPSIHRSQPAMPSLQPASRPRGGRQANQPFDPSQAAECRRHHGLVPRSPAPPHTPLTVSGSPRPASSSFATTAARPPVPVAGSRYCCYCYCCWASAVAAAAARATRRMGAYGDRSTLNAQLLAETRPAAVLGSRTTCSTVQHRVEEVHPMR